MKKLSSVWTKQKEDGNPFHIYARHTFTILASKITYRRIGQQSKFKKKKKKGKKMKYVRAWAVWSVRVKMSRGELDRPFDYWDVSFTSYVSAVGCI